MEDSSRMGVNSLPMYSMNAASSPAVATPSNQSEPPYHSIRAMVIEVRPSTIAYINASQTLVLIVALR